MSVMCLYNDNMKRAKGMPNATGERLIGCPQLKNKIEKQKNCICKESRKVFEFQK